MITALQLYATNGPYGQVLMPFSSIGLFSVHGGTSATYRLHRPKRPQCFKGPQNATNDIDDARRGVGLEGLDSRDNARVRPIIGAWERW